MVQTVFAPPAPTLLPVANSDALFPVRRIFCVGRNYEEHAREMGHDPNREPPFFFSKPADAAVASGLTLPFPSKTDNLHHEAELVVALGQGGADLTVDEAEACIWGFACGNDLTRRDLQAQAKSARRPWDMAKGFDASAIVGDLHRVDDVGLMRSGRITATIDGDLRQEGDLSDMIWPTADVIAYLSGLVELAAGDLIMTGTPAGVGPIARGETCAVTIEGLNPATVTFV